MQKEGTGMDVSWIDILPAGACDYEPMTHYQMSADKDEAVITW